MKSKWWADYFQPPGLSIFKRGYILEVFENNLSSPFSHGNFSAM